MPLILGALIGGFAGSSLGASHFHPQKMKKTLGSVLVVAIFLLSKKVFVLVSC